MSSNQNSKQPTDEQKAEILSKMIDMVTRQTEYNYDEAKKKLQENNFDYNIVIKEYMGIKPKQKDKITLNQEIFKQIRNNMDTASKNFYN